MDAPMQFGLAGVAPDKELRKNKKGKGPEGIKVLKVEDQMLGGRSFAFVEVDVKGEMRSREILIAFEFLFDSKTNRLFRLRQGKGKTFKAAGIDRTKAYFVTLLARKAARKFIERKERQEANLPLFPPDG
jgi:hypothetical protein